MAESDVITTKVDEMGRLVLPARIRRALSIKPGSEVILIRQGGKLTIQSREQALADAQAFVRSLIPPGVSLVDELIRERREEAKRENGR